MAEEKFNPDWLIALDEAAEDAGNRYDEEEEEPSKQGQLLEELATWLKKERSGVFVPNAPAFADALEIVLNEHESRDGESDRANETTKRLLELLRS